MTYLEYAMNFCHFDLSKFCKIYLSFIVGLPQERLLIYICKWDYFSGLTAVTNK